ncbi:hypothetical protein H632_c3628p0, partial [Helicosporidium sp. ATCC 50920]
MGEITAAGGAEGEEEVEESAGYRRDFGLYASLRTRAAQRGSPHPWATALCFLGDQGDQALATPMMDGSLLVWDYASGALRN